MLPAVRSYLDTISQISRKDASEISKEALGRAKCQVQRAASAVAALWQAISKLVTLLDTSGPTPLKLRAPEPVSGHVFAPDRPQVAHSIRAQQAAPIFLWVPTSGARGLTAFAEPRGPLPDSGLVSCVRPDTG